MPYLSIITPSFNQVEFVEKCLNSVGGQKFRDFEHIILDAGSTDGTTEVLQKYAAVHSNVSLSIGPDAGQVDAINKGFHAAQGEFLIWLNTDDFFVDTDVLADAEKILRATTADFVYGNGRFVDSTGEYLKDAYINTDPGRLKARMMVSVGILQPATFISKEAFLSLGDLQRQHPFCFDYEYWMRGVFNGLQFQHIERTVTSATLHVNSKTVGERLKSLRDTCDANKEKYGFASYEWLRRLADCEVNGADGILPGNDAENMAVESRLGELFSEYNSDKISISRLLSQSHIPEARTSIRALADHWQVNTTTSVITAFDDRFFTSGLTLISGLHRLEDGCSVFVYDIGLSREQRDLLYTLHHVFVLDFDTDARDFQDDYFTAATYGFKSYAMWHAAHFLQIDDRLLWLDAGIYPLTDLSSVLSLIENAGIFLVDHNDKGIWPVRNITFTSDDCITAMRANSLELSAPALRAGVAGYRVGGRFQQLFDQAFDYSLDSKALNGEKHPKPPSYKTRSGGSSEDRRRATEDPAWLHKQSTSKLRSLFGYFGHRHDQSILSILAARMHAPHYSASEFCIADEASSASSKSRWLEGKDLSTSDEIPSFYLRSGAALMQHRGLFRNTDDLKFERSSQNRSAIIMGNGPSLRGFDFGRLDRFDVFGMNAAYRYWREIDWYPSHYSCLDLVVGISHRREILELIENADRYGIRLFLLRQNLIEELGEHGRSDKVLNFDELKRHSSLLQAPTITTGSHTAAWAAALGYQHIYMLGIDCNYVERVAGSEEIGVGTELEITDEKENPNYFFNGYQRKGDRYNVPNPGRDIHMSSWREVSELIELSGTSLLNANLQSKVDSIDFCSFDDIERTDSPEVVPRERVLGESGSYRRPAVPLSNPDVSMSPDSQTMAHSPVPATTTTTGSTPSLGAPVAMSTNNTKSNNSGSQLASNGRATDIMTIAFRHAKRYGILAVPYALIMTGLLFGIQTTSGSIQLVLLGLISFGVFGGIAFVGAEAARRIRYHLHLIRKRIDDSHNAVAKQMDQLAQAQNGLVKSLQSVEELSGAITEKASIESLNKLAEELAKMATRESLNKLAEELAKMATSQAVDAISARTEKLEPLAYAFSQLSVLLEKYRQHSEQLEEELETLVSRIALTVTGEQLDYRLENVDALSARVAAMADNNLRNYNLFNRALQPSHIEQYRATWERALGVNPSERSMYYLAHRFVALETKLRGRLATDIETALVRALALESLQKETIRILEIGTLFGIGAAMLYEHGRDRFKSIEFTLLDPLDGYYGQNRDILSGIAVNEQTLIANLEEAGIPSADVTLVKHFSYEDEAIEALSEQRFDYILIDGDHTRSGVEIDFKYYAHLLSRGGLLVFDDYGSKEWPDVAEFVDEVVAADKRFSPVASGWRTAVYRRVE